MAGRLSRRLAAVLLLLLPAACSSGPDPTLYTMAAQPGIVVHATKSRSIEMRRVGLAGYLDRPGLVRATTPYRLVVTDMARWGEPLSRMIERVTIENLLMRLPDASVYSESGGLSMQPDTILEIDMQRLDVDVTGDVVLVAQVAVRHDGTRIPPASRTIRITQHPASNSNDDVVAAMSTAMAQLADEIARMIR
ncbi:PqiC family protein [Limobrevibacterium gyesilva]|uniref:PqiC family protein n=1 Tax=Limobrevibacterium gyesilva TaxID=2991712 RepID=A0AA41YK66_9PROT|nr:PqiC family protein [Limobrevibacterium gyesilva]MCW3474774.1 PqiC family protein [Limobrevibacterium gyesilva]